MKPITYLKGDATLPEKKPVAICHICNDVGKFGAGFVLSLSKRFGSEVNNPEYAYRKWFRDKNWQGQPFELGQTQVVVVNSDITICNMIAQHGVGRGTQRVDYEALRKCLHTVAVCIRDLRLLNKEYNVAMPRIGTNLGGGKWEDIEPIIIETLCDAGIEVFVYDL